jgi:hypothetical protein
MAPRTKKASGSGSTTTVVEEAPIRIGTVAPAETNGTTKPHADVVAGKKAKKGTRTTVLGTSNKFTTDVAKRVRRGAPPIQPDAVRMLNLALAAYFSEFFARAAVHHRDLRAENPKLRAFAPLGPDDVHEIVHTCL